MRELVRDTMAAYEASQGRAMRWIASKHDDPGLSHMHLVVAGYEQVGKSVAILPKDLDACGASATASGGAWASGPGWQVTSALRLASSSETSRQAVIMRLACWTERCRRCES